MKEYFLAHFLKTGGQKVSIHKLVRITWTCFIFETCCFAECRWHTVPTHSKILVPKFENSNICDHAHSIFNHEYCLIWWIPRMSCDSMSYIKNLLHWALSDWATNHNVCILNFGPPVVKYLITFFSFFCEIIIIFWPWNPQLTRFSYLFAN